MHREGANTYDICGLRGAAHRIFKQSSAQAASPPIQAHRKPRQEHERNRMAGKTFSKPFRRIVEGYLAHNESVEADNLSIR